jgi:hypothetical protein
MNELKKNKLKNYWNSTCKKAITFLGYNLLIVYVNISIYFNQGKVGAIFFNSEPTGPRTQ